VVQGADALSHCRGVRVRFYKRLHASRAITLGRLRLATQRPLPIHDSRANTGGQAARSSRAR